MDKWAKGKATDRDALFRETAARRGLSPEIVEKDFWVCWTLRQVFALTGLPNIVFKGGTSLSKVFKIISRFSEDIDLVLNRHDLGFNNENDPANQPGTNLRGRTLESLKQTCHEVIANEFAPKLRAQIASVIGDDGGWSLTEDEMAPDADTLIFQYPAGVSIGGTEGYVRRVVKLELGCRGDQVPSENGSVTPYAAEVFPSQFDDAEVAVVVISPERTFWEKATILHREYYRAEAGKPASDRVFRHYDDVAMISRHERGTKAIEKNMDLLEQVAVHKQHFFREGPARYELARKGTLRLCPSEQVRDALRRDYEKMREMYFGEAPDFDEVMETLKELESRINDV